MATYAPKQIPSDSYDTSAVSVVVADRSTTSSRAGAFFDKNFEAVSPVYFQELGNGKFFGIFSERWHTAVRPDVAVDPNLFSTYEVDSLPSWSIFDSNGQHLPIPGHGLNPETRIVSDNRIVVGACSRTNSYLYLLQRCTLGSEASAVVSHYHINPVTSEVNIIGEEKLSNLEIPGGAIVFDGGIKYSVTYLNFVGRDHLNRLYMARKNWGHIGRVPRVEYLSQKGWTENPSYIYPLRTKGGFLTSEGPVSFGEYRGNVWMSVVANESGNRIAYVYSSRGLWDFWSREEGSYPLGDDTTYMGGTVYFQPGLGANLERLGKSSINGIPLVYTKKIISEAAEGININWDIWPIHVYNSQAYASDAALEIDTEAYASS